MNSVCVCVCVQVNTAVSYCWSEITASWRLYSTCRPPTMLTLRDSVPHTTTTHTTEVVIYWLTMDLNRFFTSI